MWLSNTTEITFSFEETVLISRCSAFFGFNQLNFSRLYLREVDREF
jgi:hypothetical protein